MSYDTALMEVAQERGEDGPDLELFDEFVERAKAEIDDFAAEWRRGMAGEDPDHWPEIMTPGEWDEQLRAHLGD